MKLERSSYPFSTTETEGSSMKQSTGYGEICYSLLLHFVLFYHIFNTFQKVKILV